MTHQQIPSAANTIAALQEALSSPDPLEYLFKKMPASSGTRGSPSTQSASTSKISSPTRPPVVPALALSKITGIPDKITPVLLVQESQPLIDTPPPPPLDSPIPPPPVSPVPGVLDIDFSDIGIDLHIHRTSVTSPAKPHTTSFGFKFQAAPVVSPQKTQFRTRNSSLPSLNASPQHLSSQQYATPTLAQSLKNDLSVEYLEGTVDRTWFNCICFKRCRACSKNTFCRFSFSKHSYATSYISQNPSSTSITSTT